MPKKFLKRFLPDHLSVRQHKYLQFFGTLLHDPNLWHLNRRSVPSAVSIGLFVAFVPIPFQMVLAAALAIIFRANLPIAATVVWITNPVTMAPIFYFAYKLGALILDTTVQKVHFELTLSWLLNELVGIWQPFLLGCLVLGSFSAMLGNVVIRSYWRLEVIRKLKERRLRKKRHSLSSSKRSTTDSKPE